LNIEPALAAALPFSKAEISVFSIAENGVIKHTLDPADRAARELSKAALALDNRALFEHLAPDSERALLSAYHQQLNTKSGWKLSPKPKSAVRGWQHSFLPTTRLYFGEIVQRGGRAQLSDFELDRLFNEAISKAWLQFYSGALNRVREIQEGGLRKILEEVLAPGAAPKTSDTEVDPDAAYKKAKRFLLRQGKSASIGTASQFKDRYRDNEELRRVVGNVDEIESAIEKAMDPVEKFLTTITSLFSRDKTLQLRNNELQVALASGESMPLSGLSSGEKHLVKILLAVIAAGPNAVLIDEPELSMHIDWQRALVKTLRAVNPECQLILASHSPEVMADVPDQCIFKL
jgi:hypothetical protein